MSEHFHEKRVKALADYTGHMRAQLVSKGYGGGSKALENGLGLFLVMTAAAIHWREAEAAKESA